MGPEEESASMKGRRWWRSLSAGQATPLKGMSHPMQVAIAADKDRLPRVIQIPREAYVPERLAEVAKHRTRAPPEGEPDPLVNGGILKDLVVVAKRRNAASPQGQSDRPQGKCRS
jgi:hypothetical protein